MENSKQTWDFITTGTIKPVLDSMQVCKYDCKCNIPYVHSGDLPGSQTAKGSSNWSRDLKCYYYWKCILLF